MDDVENRHDTYDPSNCACVMCAVRKPFEMPVQIVDAFNSGELVVFAGAGTSTESRSVLPTTLYTDVHEALGMNAQQRMPFPEIMQRYEDQHGRASLLKRIKQRIDYVRSFPELNRAASRFHRTLASAFPITDIITTNWDDYFERECGATPYITEQDWAFWRERDRKVFKLHGSLSSPGSIIATSSDYKRCYREFNKGLIGATLKTMLATKTVVFLGYSFGDADFNAIYSLLKKRMRDILPRAYIVTLQEREPPIPAADLHVIQTDVVYFIEQLIREIPESESIPDSRLDAAPQLAEIISIIHTRMLEQVPLAEHPDVVMAAFYQDGLIHAFEHQDANRGKGDYSHRCYVEKMIDVYLRLRTERLRHRQYGEVAYVDGYLEGLTYLLDGGGGRARPRVFYLFGHDNDIKSIEEFVSAAQQAGKLHKSAHREAVRIAQAHASFGTIPHHRPMLLPANGRIEEIDGPAQV